jgi:hypothetical protein
MANRDEPAPTTGEPESSGASDSPRSATHASTQRPTRPADGAADTEEPARPATPAFQLPAKPPRPRERPVTREATREAETEISPAERVHRDVEHPSGDQPSFDHIDPFVARDELGEGL